MATHGEQSTLGLIYLAILLDVKVMKLLLIIFLTENFTDKGQLSQAITSGVSLEFLFSFFTQNHMQLNTSIQRR
jgi:hypothetical protein